MQHELAERSDAGIVVRLLWDEEEDRVFIAYRDDRTGDSFRADVPRDQARTAFEHPNAYRALQRIASAA